LVFRTLRLIRIIVLQWPALLCLATTTQLTRSCHIRAIRATHLSTICR
jgi:hypothetical protein